MPRPGLLDSNRPGVHAGGTHAQLAWIGPRGSAAAILPFVNLTPGPVWRWSLSTERSADSLKNLRTLSTDSTDV